MTKRIFGLTVFTAQDPPTISDNILDFALDGGWGIELSIPSVDAVSYFTDTAKATRYCGVIQSIIDAGIPVCLEIQNAIFYGDGGPPTPTVDTTIAEYEGYFNDCLALYEELGSQFTGYAFEGGFDNSITWLKNNISSSRNIYLHFVTGWAWYYYGSGVVPALGAHDMAWRVAQVDEVAWNAYSVGAMYQCPSFKTWLESVAPTTPFGLVTGWQNAGGNWWNPSTQPWLDGSIVASTAAAQKERLTNYLLRLKYSIGAVDVLIADPDWLGVNPQSVIDNCNYIDKLNLRGPGRRVDTMQQQGTVPEYLGASYCGYDSHDLIDTFVNTGNELILLKNYTGSAARNITVTSSLDPLTHEDYNLTLSPNRGTFIGPYPLDEYGALPTITYDNTNLYVSILNVEPTA